MKCRLCGHDPNRHWYETGKVICRDCPGERCQDGPDGRAYREEEKKKQ